MTIEDIIDQTCTASIFLRNFTEEHFGVYLVTGPQQGPYIPLNIIGKVVQVRKESGQFGSDIVLLRKPDGVLQSHENQCFFIVPNHLISELEDKYEEDAKSHDNGSNTYSIDGYSKEKGFIIPSKIKKGETTPLREVRSQIYEKIGELITTEKNNK